MMNSLWVKSFGGGTDVNEVDFSTHGHVDLLEEEQIGRVDVLLLLLQHLRLLIIEVHPHPPVLERVFPLRHTCIVSGLVAPCMADIAVQFVELLSLLVQAVLGNVEILDPLQVDIKFEEHFVRGDFELLHVENEDVGSILQGFSSVLLWVTALFAFHFHFLRFLSQLQTFFYCDFIVDLHSLCIC